MTILRGAPYFPVADVATTVSYYTTVLDFVTEYVAGTPPVFGICGRDGCAVMLRRVDRPELIRPSEAQGGTWDAFFWVDDVASLHRELQSRGATIVYGPAPQAYGMIEFAVRDCDGHVLGFGQADT